MPTRRLLTLKSACVVGAAIIALGAVGFLLGWYGDRHPLPPAIDAGVLQELGKVGRARGFNVVLVTLDTTRADRLGCYGSDLGLTPAIDGLARHAVRFQHTAAATPTTLPSHSTIMTGLIPPHHGVRNNATFTLSDDSTTLAEVLQQAGYRTGAFIGSYVLAARYGLAQGFDLYDDDVVVKSKNENDRFVNQRPADAVSDAAIAWLRKLKDSGSTAPFFAWIHYFDPHYPYEPPASFLVDDRSPYDGEIAFVDSQLARVVQFLADTNLLNRTLVVVTADHGEALGEHEEFTHGIFIYDETISVPLIFSCPALFESEVVAQRRLACQADIMPTILGLLGVQPPRNLDGVNLLTAPPDERRAVYIESLLPLLNHGWAGLHGLRRIDDKFILAPKPEYYDLLRDPKEQENRFAGNARASELKDALATILADQPPDDSLFGQVNSLDREQIERLEALGYFASRSFEGKVGTDDPKDMIGLYQKVVRATYLNEQGQHEKALELVEDVLKTNPNDARAWEVVSWANQALGRFDAAEKATRRMLELEPTAQQHARLANFLLARREFLQCDRELDRALALDPHEGDIYVTRGNLYFVQDRFQEALAQYERAIDIDPYKSGPLARQMIERVKARLAEKDTHTTTPPP